MKICNRCGDSQEFNKFSKKTTSKDGYASLCKKCQKDYARAYYKQNKEISEKTTAN